MKSIVLISVLCLLAPFASAEYNETEFKQIVTNDRTNDDAKDLTTEELIVRSGFRFEVYFSIADDGYISQIIRLINPKADLSKLKQPPVLLIHGAYFDTSSFLLASSIQHHPEKYPRTAADGPWTSSNRSLGFTLSNLGFDVFLVGARGSNRACQAYTSNPKALKQQLRQQNGELTFRPNESMYQFVNTNDYWQYSFDDVAEFELNNQIDLVTQVTGSREYQMFAYSLGTANTMAFLAIRPEYARRMRSYIQMAPTIAPSHFTLFPKVYAEYLVPILPSRGDGFTPTYTLDKILKEFVVATSASSMTLRYSLISQLLRGLYGPSPNYQTNLELNFLGHLFKQVSFKSIKQYGQNSVSKKFTKYDYGPLRNLQLYSQPEPPVYNISCLEVQNYAIISGEVDALASPDTVDRLIATVKCPALFRHFVAPQFNHIDLLAGVETARYIIGPAVELFEQFKS